MRVARSQCAARKLKIKPKINWQSLRHDGSSSSTNRRKLSSTYRTPALKNEKNACSVYFGYFYRHRFSVSLLTILRLWFRVDLLLFVMSLFVVANTSTARSIGRRHTRIHSYSFEIGVACSKWRNTIFPNFDVYFTSIKLMAIKNKCEKEIKIKKSERDREVMEQSDGEKPQWRRCRRRRQSRFRTIKTTMTHNTHEQHRTQNGNRKHRRSTFSLFDGFRNVCGTRNSCVEKCFHGKSATHLSLTPE